MPHKTTPTRPHPHHSRCLLSFLSKLPTSSKLFSPSPSTAATDQGWRRTCEAYIVLVSHSPETQCGLPPLLQPLYTNSWLAPSQHVLQQSRETTHASVVVTVYFQSWLLVPASPTLGWFGLPSSHCDQVTSTWGERGWRGQRSQELDRILLRLCVGVLLNYDSLYLPNYLSHILVYELTRNVHKVGHTTLHNDRNALRS